MKTEIDLTPNFHRLFDVFHREVEIRASTVLADMDRDENGMTKRTTALETMLGLIQPLNACAQCATTVEEIMRLRDLLAKCMTELQQRVQEDTLKDQRDFSCIQEPD